MSTSVTICLCTYRRPQLAATLDSLARQQLADSIEFDISVADNDPDGSGKAIVDAFRQQHSIAIHYVVQPQKNIAITRNVTVAQSTGEWLAFIDDDEEADSDWLQRLLDCSRQYQANAVVGQVITVYPPSTPTWISRGNLLGRRCAATGTPMKVGLTGNSLVHRSVLPHPTAPFDPKLGTTGGEDSAFFSHIHHHGGIIVACREAIVSETAELHRLNAEYLLQQATRVGETYARNFIHEQTPQRRCILYTKAMIRGLLDLLCTLVLRPFGLHRSFRYRMGMNIQWGKLRGLLPTKAIEMYK